MHHITLTQIAFILNKLFQFPPVWFDRALNIFYLFVYFFIIQMNESIIAKTTITVPVNGGAVEAVSTIETVPYWTRSSKSGKNI